jgi:hypothetical protein
MSEKTRRLSNVRRASERHLIDFYKLEQAINLISDIRHHVNNSREIDATTLINHLYEVRDFMDGEYVELYDGGKGALTVYEEENKDK